MGGDAGHLRSLPKAGTADKKAPPKTQCPIRSFSQAEGHAHRATDIGVKNRALESPFPLLPGDGP